MSLIFFVSLLFTLVLPGSYGLPINALFYDAYAFAKPSSSFSRNLTRPRQEETVGLDLPNYGPILGLVEQTFKGRTVHAFRGIPYSKAKRFEASMTCIHINHCVAGNGRSNERIIFSFI
jgi:hypothetical protein